MRDQFNSVESLLVHVVRVVEVPGEDDVDRRPQKKE